MVNMIKIVIDRVKELESLVEMLPVNKSFTAQSRLIEAKHILELLKAVK